MNVTPHELEQTKLVDMTHAGGAWAASLGDELGGGVVDEGVHVCEGDTEGEGLVKQGEDADAFRNHNRPKLLNGAPPLLKNRLSTVPQQ